jgi:hypothetical protein
MREKAAGEAGVFILAMLIQSRRIRFRPALTTVP